MMFAPQTLLILLVVLHKVDGFVAISSRVNSQSCYNHYHYWDCDISLGRTSTTLHLFQTRKRIRRVYQSIRNRFRRRRRRNRDVDEDNHADKHAQFTFPSATPEDRRALASALQEGNVDTYKITLTECEENESFKLVGSETKISSSAGATTMMSALLEGVEGQAAIKELYLRLVSNEETTNGIEVESPEYCCNGNQKESLDTPSAITRELPRNGVLEPSNGKNIQLMPTSNIGKVWESTKGELFVANGKSAQQQLEIQAVRAAANNTMTATLTRTTEPMVEQEEPVGLGEKIQPLGSLYTLPPLDRTNLTRLETEFRDMLEYFCQFTQADLYTIRDPRVRAIMEGVVSGSNEAPVYRAFEVLFEDLPPLRVAGRMIYSKLKNLMLKAQARAQEEVDDIVESTGLSTQCVQTSRLAFLTLAIPTEQEHDDKQAHLTLEQLVDCGLAEKAMNAVGHDDFNALLNNLDPNQTGKVTFPELMTGIQKTAQEACAVDRCDPADVLQSVVREMEPTMGRFTTNKQLDRKRQKYSDRYDSMVAAFQEWDDIVPEGEGRRLDVLRGCFVGAANQRVVEALKVVYLDYSALRLAGNSIFAIMKTLVGKIRKRKSKRKSKG